MQIAMAIVVKKRRKLKMLLGLLAAIQCAERVEQVKAKVSASAACVMSSHARSILQAAQLLAKQDWRGGSLPGRIKALPRRVIPCSWWFDYLPVTFAGGMYPELFDGRPREEPLYPPRRFHEVFRIPFALFERIEQDLRAEFDGGPDCVGIVGHRAPIKILACLRSFGNDSSLIDMVCRVCCLYYPSADVPLHQS